MGLRVAEHHQILRELCALLREGQDRPSVLDEIRVRAPIPRMIDGRVRHHPDQDVAEVVSDPPRQATHGLPLAQLRQLRLARPERRLDVPERRRLDLQRDAVRDR